MHVLISTVEWMVHNFWPIHRSWQPDKMPTLFIISTIHKWHRTVIWFLWTQVCLGSTCNFPDKKNIFYFLCAFYIGCEYGGYSSDITRTWPVNGELTKPQAILYDVVHNVQLDLLHVLSIAENISLDNLFDLMCQRLGKYLKEAVLKPGPASADDMMRQTAFRFCPHHVSHYLGMDIHDTPSIPRTRMIVPGMVFTVEPGANDFCHQIVEKNSKSFRL